MGEVYSAAALTIIAAAGKDASHGLPGLSPIRRQPLKYEQIGKTYLYALPSLNGLKSAQDSVWASRAWTYQEGFLSRRRLIFVDQQVLYVCQKEFRYEDGPSLLLTESGEFARDEAAQAGWTPRTASISTSLPGPLGRAIKFVETYSSRSLRYDGDALKAISGALNTLRTEDTYHIWGVPFCVRSRHLSAEVCKRHSQMIESAERQKIDYTASPPTTTVVDLYDSEYEYPFDFDHSIQTGIAGPQPSDDSPQAAIALSWTHGGFHRQSHRRRSIFPSWSPMGWECAVSFCGAIDMDKVSVKTDSGTTPLSTLVPHCGSILPELPQLLHLETETADVKFHLARLIVERVFCSPFQEPSRMPRVTLRYDDYAFGVATPAWDIDPAVFEDGKSLKIALLRHKVSSGDAGRHVMLLLREHGDYYERIGLISMDRHTSFTERCTLDQLDRPDDHVFRIGRRLPGTYHWWDQCLQKETVTLC